MKNLGTINTRHMHDHLKWQFKVFFVALIAHDFINVCIYHLHCSLFKYDDIAAHYIYTWNICQTKPDEKIAITQSGKGISGSMDLGKYANAQVIGGSKYLLNIVYKLFKK